MYAHFNLKINGDAVLKTQFLENLDRFSKQSQAASKLYDILVKEKVYTWFWRSSDSMLDGIYLIMIKGGNDPLLNKLASSCRFPRGFPLIWVPDMSIDMFGFYPKFENDVKSQEVTDIKDFQNVDEINFNFKYSGFLGQIIAFEYKGQPFWTSCSKNATSNEFAGWAREIIQPKMSQELVHYMIQHKIHFSGEVMSFDDMGHGAEVLSEAFVVTSVAHGHYVDVHETKGYCHKDGVNYFVNFFNQEQTQEFCLHYGLSVDSIYKIKNGAEFLKTLSDNRDLMTLSSFHQFWTEFALVHPESVELKEGNIRHEKVLGNDLEGLIIKVSYSDERLEKTIKYKFPNYTLRTMFLRDFLAKHKSLLIPNIYFAQVERFVEHWVVDDTIGRPFWRYIASEIILNYNSFVQSHVNKKIGLHIHLADQMQGVVCDETLAYMDLYQANVQKMHEHLSTMLKHAPLINLVLALGPVGVGKSSIGEKIAEINRFKHIDGDILDLEMSDVLKLKSERGDYTRYKVIESVTNDQVPVLSTGGGVLLNSKGTACEFTNDIVKIFGEHILKTTIFLPSLDVKTVTQVMDIDGFVTSHLDDMDIIFDDLERIKHVVEERKACGILHKTFDKNIFVKVNKSNKVITKTIIRDLHMKGQLTSLFLFPVIDSGNRAKVLSGLVPLDLHIKNIDPSALKFQQKRFLVDYNLEGEKMFHHITCEFGDVSFEESSLKNLVVDGTFFDVPKVNMYTQFLVDYKTLFIQIKTKVDETKNDSFNKKLELCESSRKMFETLGDFAKHMFVLDNKLEGSVKDLNDIAKRLKLVHKNSDLVIPKGSIKFIKVNLDELNVSDDLKSRAHVTIDSGAHVNADVKIVAEFVSRATSDSLVLSLKTKHGRMVDYQCATFDSQIYHAPHKAIKVHLHSVFYIAAR
jgi:hypothetical protein